MKLDSPNVRMIIDRCLVEVLPHKDVSPGGVILLEVHHDPGKEIGLVHAVGPGLAPKGKLHPTELKPGDHVLFSRFAGDDVEWCGKDCVIIHESEIIAKIPDLENFRFTVHYAGQNA